MFRKHGKFYADWREGGARRRREFATEAEARRHEDAQHVRNETRVTVRVACQRLHAATMRRSEDGYSVSNNASRVQTLRNLAVAVGGLACARLAQRHVIDLIANCWRHYKPSSKYTASKALRRILRELVAYGAPTGLDLAVPRCTPPRPRSNTVPEDVRLLLLERADPALRFLLLACSNLALRSGTARRVAPCHVQRRHDGVVCLSLRTKYGTIAQLPLTERMLALIAQAPQLGEDVPYVRALSGVRTGKDGWSPATVSRRFMALKKRCGVSLSVRLHDFRRTAALRLYEHTEDLLLVKHLLAHEFLSSTFWYVDRNTARVTKAQLDALAGCTPQPQPPTPPRARRRYL